MRWLFVMESDVWRAKWIIERYFKSFFGGGGGERFLEDKIGLFVIDLKVRLFDDIVHFKFETARYICQCHICQYCWKFSYRYGSILPGEMLKMWIFIYHLEIEIKKYRLRIDVTVSTYACQWISKFRPSPGKGNWRPSRFGLVPESIIPTAGEGGTREIFWQRRRLRG